MAKADKNAAPAEAAAPAAEAAPAPKPAPVDTRLKVLKKFRGRFLPKGPLRDRLNVLMTRWDSGDDHGGVTYDELKALHADWMTSRNRKAKNKAVQA